MSVKSRAAAASVLAVAAFVAFAWLWTFDVSVSEHNVDGEAAFCGSAYDVILLKGNGYMGGEVPSNQRAIDRACVKKAGRDLLAGGAAGVVGLAAAVYVAVSLHRRSVPAHEVTARTLF